MKKYERIIFLHQALKEGAQFRISSISVRLGVSNRTIQRDFNQLKGLGVPIVNRKCKYFIANGKAAESRSAVQLRNRKRGS